MSNRLIKDITAAHPGIPGTPPFSGSPPGPAHCVTTFVTVPYYERRTGYDTRSLILQEVAEGTPGAHYLLRNGPNEPGRWYVWIPNPNLGQYYDVWLIVGFQAVPVVTCYPGTPAIPPSPGSPGLPAVPANFNMGWSGSAVSNDYLVDEGTYRFQVTAPVVGAVTGFNSANVGSGYIEIDHAFYLAGTSYRVMEAGVYKTANASYDSDTVFRIIRFAGVVYYTVDDVLVYTSATASNGQVFVDASLFMGGDEIVDAVLSTDVDTTYMAVSGGVAGVLTPLAGSGSDAADDGYKNESGLFELIGEGVGSNLGLNGVLTGLTGVGAGSYGDGTAYSSGTGVLTGITGGGEGSGIVDPSWAVGRGVLQGLVGFGVGLTGVSGECEGVLGGFIEGFGAQDGDADIRNPELTGLTGGGWADDTAVQGVMEQTASQATLYAFGDIPTITGSDGARVPGYGLYGTASQATIAAMGAGQLRATASQATISASGTTTLLGYLTKTASEATISASGTTTVLGRLTRTYQPKATLLGIAGGRLAASYDTAPTISASGLSGLVGGLTKTASQATIVASGFLTNLGSCAGILTGLSMGLSGVLRATASQATIRASGYITAAAAYEAYSITLIPTEKGTATATTRYATFPFDRIIRFRGVYYGVAADGLYALGGDDFDGAPIVSTVVTAESDHGYPQRKHAVALYVAGRAGADMDVTVVSNELDEEIYQYSPLNKEGARNYRAKFGKGIHARYWAYKFTNINGEDFAFDDMTPEVAVSKRML